MENLFLKYRIYMAECEQGLHDSDFATRLVRLSALKERMRDVVSDWQNAGVDFCLELDKKGIFVEELKKQGITGPSTLLSHATIILEQIESIMSLVYSYIDEYFKAGINIEEKRANGETITEEELKVFEQIDKKNPIADKSMSEAECFLTAKCYIDILKESELFANDGEFGLVDEVNELLFLIAGEFKTYFALNPNSFDKVYLKYLLNQVGEDGLSRVLYDPAEARILLRSHSTRGKRVLKEGQSSTSEVLEGEGSSN